VHRVAGLVLIVLFYLLVERLESQGAPDVGASTYLVPR